MKINDHAKPALLVIDVQRYFFEPDGGAFIDGAPAILPNIFNLIDTFRKAHLPLVFTRHAHKRGDPTGQMGRWWREKLPWDKSRESELIDRITPRPDELIVTKTRYSAFENTGLDEHLRKCGVDTVVVCGVMTNLCVETSARHAFMKDFQPVIARDACAANTQNHHEASILNLSYGFALIKTAKEISKQVLKS